MHRPETKSAIPETIPVVSSSMTDDPGPADSANTGAAGVVTPDVAE